MPSISYNGEIITESAVVTQFLVDAFPSHLLPPSTTEANALFRARVAFFVDAVISKVLPHIFAGQRAQDPDAKDAAAEDLIAAIVKEVEPLFTWEGKGPFFGGSEKPTLAEVCLSCQRELLLLPVYHSPHHCPTVLHNFELNMMNRYKLPRSYFASSH